MTGERAFRFGLGALGVAGIVYGIVRILGDSAATHPQRLALWLIGALLVHDAIIAPAVLGGNLVLSRLIPPRVRPFVQGGLIAGGLVAVIGAFMIKRQDKYSSPALALLRQNYTLNLAILLALIAAASLTAYLVSVRRASRTKSRPSADH
jgi:heme A synthase